MTHTVAICNQKGGVGKTALTINLGAALSDLGQRVLLIDLDPQGHLTEGVGLHELYLNNQPNNQPTLYDCLVNGKAAHFPALIQQPPEESFFVVPSSYEMMLAEQSLFMARNREHKLKELLPTLEGRFDWVLIDCPPALGNLTDNALNAAREVVVPIHANHSSVRALELLFDQIESVERGLHIQIRVLAVVPNEVEDSTLSKRTLADLRASIPSVTPFDIRKRVLLQEAWSSGHSIFAYRAAGKEKTRNEIVATYRQLAAFVLTQVEGASAVLKGGGYEGR